MPSLPSSGFLFNRELCVKIDVRPHRIKCPDCPAVFPTFQKLQIHWKKAWRNPRMWGKHWKPGASGRHSEGTST